MFKREWVGGTFCAKVYMKNTDYCSVGTTRKLNRSSNIGYFDVCYSLVLQLSVFNSLLYIVILYLLFAGIIVFMRSPFPVIIYKYEQT